MCAYRCRMGSHIVSARWGGWPGVRRARVCMGGGGDGVWVLLGGTHGCLGVVSSTGCPCVHSGLLGFLLWVPLLQWGN